MISQLRDVEKLVVLLKFMTGTRANVFHVPVPHTITPVLKLVKPVPRDAITVLIIPPLRELNVDLALLIKFLTQV